MFFLLKRQTTNIDGYRICLFLHILYAWSFCVFVYIKLVRYGTLRYGMVLFLKCKCKEKVFNNLLTSIEISFLINARINSKFVIFSFKNVKFTTRTVKMFYVYLYGCPMGQRQLCTSMTSRVKK